MNAFSQSAPVTRFRVGLFALLGVMLMMGMAIMINGRPSWWRGCNLVTVHVKDATGLKSNSSVRSLGIDIGYLRFVELDETQVTLGLCLVSPVEVLPETRAYIRGEGFLGDKFIELKPIRYLSPISSNSGLGGFLLREAAAEESEGIRRRADGSQGVDSEGAPEQAKEALRSEHLRQGLKKRFSSEAKAAEAPAVHHKRTTPESSEILVGQESEDMQRVVSRVDHLVKEMSGLTENLKNTLNPVDMKETLRQINQTLENASKTLSPKGGLTVTAQRTLGKLEEGIDQLREMLTRINHGEGSLGKLVNDPRYAEEIYLALKNINKLLNRVADVRFHLDLGGVFLSGYSGGRGWLNLSVWPRKDRYYMFGISMDPRGRLARQVITTTSGGVSTSTTVQVEDQTSLLLTGMLGKTFFGQRLDLSAGVRYGDGTVSILGNLGPEGQEEQLAVRSDFYFRGANPTLQSGGGLDLRLSVTYQPLEGTLHAVTVMGGLESLRVIPGQGLSFFAGAGLTFDDDDIKLLFSLK